MGGNGAAREKSRVGSGGVEDPNPTWGNLQTAEAPDIGRMAHLLQRPRKDRSPVGPRPLEAISPLLLALDARDEHLLGLLRSAKVVLDATDPARLPDLAELEQFCGPPPLLDAAVVGVF
jgi:hypothetical protein